MGATNKSGIKHCQRRKFAYFLYANQAQHCRHDGPCLLQRLHVSACWPRLWGGVWTRKTSFFMYMRLYNGGFVVDKLCEAKS